MTAFRGATFDYGRGGVAPPPWVPSWLPSSAWQWTSIPNSTWSNYVKDDGTGVAIAAGGTGIDTSYSALWPYCAPAYSAARHEMYLFGGGHAQSTINLLTRWNLGSDTPSVSVASAQTADSARVARFAAFATPDNDGTRTYFADGKPYSSHTYRNVMYSDAADELLIFGFGFMASPGAGGTGGGNGWTSRDVAGWPRGGSWRAQGAYGNLPIDQPAGPRFLSSDGTTVYYWEAASGATSTTLRKWVRATNTYSTVGTSAIGWYSRAADDGAVRALVLGSASSSGAWDAQFVDLATGATQTVTVGGDSLPSGRGIYGLVYCPAQGYWLAVFFNAAALYANSVTPNAISAITVATITPTGASTATATVRTMTGTAPTTCLPYHGLFFDPAFGCALLVTDRSTPIQAIKVA